MILILKLSGISILFLVAGCACLVASANNNIGRSSGITTTESPPNKIDDADYWDADDFVPYKDERHDTFDWKLFRVSLKWFVTSIYL